jgi:uncharacterized peroxidase-related enzyme
LLSALARDWRAAALGAREAELCAFAEKLTRTPSAMSAGDVERLRAAGLDDRAVHDAAAVVAYFNYINRVADALDVDLEAEMPPHPRANADGGERAAPG